MIRRSHNPSSDDRLFAAADALLDAVASPLGLATPIIVRIEGDDPDEPERPDVFTENELLAAMKFLVRLGCIPVPSRGDAEPAQGDQRQEGANERQFSPRSSRPHLWTGQYWE